MGSFVMKTHSRKSCLRPEGFKMEMTGEERDGEESCSDSPRESLQGQGLGRQAAS